MVKLVSLIKSMIVVASTLSNIFFKRAACEVLFTDFL